MFSKLLPRPGHKYITEKHFAIQHKQFRRPEYNTPKIGQITQNAGNERYLRFFPIIFL